MSLPQTPSQTIGPFHHHALPKEGWEIVAGEGAQGQRIELQGRLVDGAGQPVGDALMEIWQANAEGKYDHPDDTQHKPVDPAFHGYGRFATRPDGSYRFVTVRPGPVPGAGNSWQAPHVAVSIFARGLLKRLVTRIYFEDSPENAEDPILGLIPEAERRATLVAKREAGDPVVYRLDIVLQGDDETVFFDV